MPVPQRLRQQSLFPGGQVVLGTPIQRLRPPLKRCHYSPHRFVEQHVDDLLQHSAAETFADHLEAGDEVGQHHRFGVLANAGTEAPGTKQAEQSKTFIRSREIDAVSPGLARGLIAATLTEIAGSSAAFSRGYVTYSNAAKTEMLGVPAALTEAHGAVSEQVARAMAEGAIASADIAIAVTGIAGPGGATPGKPVGLVHFGLAMQARPIRTENQIFAGDRSTIRRATVD